MSIRRNCFNIYILLLLIVITNGAATKAQQPYCLDSLGNYRLLEWNADNPAGNYPTAMTFYHADKVDPTSQSVAGATYSGAYNERLTGYIYGLGADGFAFQNNASSQLGMAVLKLNTENRKNIYVCWTGRTVKKNSARTYALTCEVKLPGETLWTILDEYVSSVTANNNAGDFTEFQPLRLPERYENAEEVQLRWIYNYVDGKGGRPCLGVDDILITSSPIIAPEISAIITDGLQSHWYVGANIPNFKVNILKSGNELQSDYNGWVYVNALKNGVLMLKDSALAVNGSTEFSDLVLMSGGNYHVVFTCSESEIAYSEEISINPEIVFSEELIPAYMTGFDRFPFTLPDDFSDKKHNWKIPAYALIKLENLFPGVEYRYNVRAVPEEESDLTGGKGANIYFDEVRDSVYFSSLFTAAGHDSLQMPQPFSSFIADSDTKYLWINIVPNALGMFEGGKKINWVVNLAESSGYIFKRFRSVQTTETVKFGWLSENATGITDTASLLSEGNYVALFGGGGDVEENGRKLLSISTVQNDGATLIDQNNDTGEPFPPSGPEFYIASDNKPHSWATIIPNAILRGNDTLTAGITEIKILDANGNIVSDVSDSDGIWGGVNTNFTAGGKYYPVYFSTPAINYFAIDENLCSGDLSDYRIKTRGTDTVNIYYKRAGTETFGILRYDVPTEQDVNGGASYFELKNEFLANVSDYGDAIILKLESKEHPEVFAESNPFHYYRSPEFSQINGGGIYCNEDTVTLSVDILGNYAGLQWFKNGIALVGADRRVLKIFNAGFNSAGEYSCRATGCGNCPDASTGDIVVYIQNETRIIDQPKDVYAGLKGKAVFSVTSNAVGVPDSYNPKFQWFRNGVALSDNNKYSGSHSSLLTVIDLCREDDNAEFAVEVTGLCRSAMSETAKIGIVDFEIAAISSDTAVCSGESLELAVNVVGSGSINYAWFKNGRKIENTDFAKFTVENATLEDAGFYYVELTDTASGFSILSDTIRVIVNTPPFIEMQPQNSYDVSAGEILDLEITVSDATGCSFAWYKDGELIENSASQKLSVAVVGDKQSGTYYCTITNNCGSVRSDDIEVNVIPEGLASVGAEQNRNAITAIKPNPLVSECTVDFIVDSPAGEDVTMYLSDESGRKIADIVAEKLSAGRYSVVINAEKLDLSSGTYFLIFISDTAICTRKISVIK